MRHLLLLTVTLAAALPTFAQPARVVSALDSGDPGERALILQYADAERHPFIITTEQIGRDGSITSTAASISESPATVHLPAVSKPTFVRITATTDTQADKPLARWCTIAWPAGQIPAKYRGPSTEVVSRKEFDAYWRQVQLECRAIKSPPRVTRLPDRDTSGCLFHRVEIPSIGGVTVVGWYLVPKSLLDERGRIRGKAPAVLILPGYGAEEPPDDRSAQGLITLSLSPRGHGPSKPFWTTSKELLLDGIDTRDDYFYRRAIADSICAAQFLLRQPEVSRLGVEGGSQGGLLAIGVAALEPRVRAVCANVVCFADFEDSIPVAARGPHKNFRDYLGQVTGTARSTAVRNLALIDAANLVRRVYAPLQVVMGGLDDISPALSGPVLINRSPAKVKELIVLPEYGHALPPPMKVANKRWFEAHLKSSPKTRPRTR